MVLGRFQSKLFALLRIPNRCVIANTARDVIGVKSGAEYNDPDQGVRFTYYD